MRHKIRVDPVTAFRSGGHDLGRTAARDRDSYPDNGGHEMRADRVIASGAYEQLRWMPDLIRRQFEREA